MAVQQRPQQRRQAPAKGRPTPQRKTKRRKRQQVDYNTLEKVSCEVTKMPPALFWRGLYVKDVCQIRLMTQKERRANGYGKPDVEVKSTAMGMQYKYRRDIENNYLDPDGNTIKTRMLHTNKIYAVQQPLVTPIKVLYIPPSEPKNGKIIQYTLNGKPLRLRNYIVFQMDNAGNVIWGREPLLLPRMGFKRMVQPADTFDTVKKRAARWKAKSGLTTQQQYLSGEFRIVAKLEDVNTYKVVGFVLSYQKDGQFIESDYPMKQVEGLVKERRVRNMSQNYKLTYGKIEDLPTKFCRLQKVERTAQANNNGNKRQRR